MSRPSPALEHPGRQRLPAWLRPRAQAAGGADGGRGSRAWLLETALLALIGVFLAVATVDDLVRQDITNQRLNADLRTWRHYTRHDYHNISVDQLTLGLASKREILCGNTSPGPPGARAQICLLIWGPVVDGLRSVHGGWYLPAYRQDERGERYGCFGAAARGRCAR